MKRIYILSVLLICYGIIFSSRLVAQIASGDSLVYTRAVNNAISLYHQSLGYQSALYNASAYPGYPFNFKEGHPFFFSDKRDDTGSIVYDGVLFEKQPLQYNEISDVVILHLNGSAMQLVSEKVSRFSIFDNHFVRMLKDSSENGVISEGFYNLLYEGRTSLLGREIISIRKEIKGVDEGILYYADRANFYYVRKGNRFFPVRSKKDMLNVFAEKKTEIRQFIRTNKLKKFRKNRTRQLTLVTAYFDQLTK